MTASLNLYTWYSEREITFAPVHFTVVKVLITPESKQWIFEKLLGRFCMVESPYYGMPSGLAHYDFGYYPAFEDPAEATFFQLIWS
jgi:hypothetical protein